MMVLLVIVLIVISIIISNFLVKLKEEDKNQLKEKKSVELKDFLLMVRDLDPEIELDFLLEYKFDSNLNKNDRIKVENRIISFSTNYSYFIVKKIISLKEENRKHIDKIQYLEHLIMENGFPSVSGLSEVYIEFIHSLQIKNYIIELISKFKKINILKFIEFVESDIIETDIGIFVRDKENLLNTLENNENI